MSKINQSYSPAETLSILSQGRAEQVKALAETLIDALDPVYVLKSRTGLVMLPYMDTAKGSAFHIGEIMASEAHIRVQDGVEGYAVCMGRDLEFAMALALVDAALTCGVERETISTLAEHEESYLAEQDDLLLRDIAATRVEMETF